MIVKYPVYLWQRIWFWFSSDPGLEGFSAHPDQLYVMDPVRPPGLEGEELPL